MANLRHRARRLTVIITGLLLLMLLVAVGAWLYGRFEPSSPLRAQVDESASARTGSGWGVESAGHPAPVYIA